jgi:hypothetical protein
VAFEQHALPLLPDEVGQADAPNATARYIEWYLRVQGVRLMCVSTFLARWENCPSVSHAPEQLEFDFRVDAPVRLRGFLDLSVRAFLAHGHESDRRVLNYYLALLDSRGIRRVGQLVSLHLHAVFETIRGRRRATAIRAIRAVEYELAKVGLSFGLRTDWWSGQRLSLVSTISMESLG